jgi:hypothetical protein
MLFEPHENVIDIPVGDTTKAAAGGGEKKPFYFQILMKKYPWSHWVFAYFVGIIYFLSFRLESSTILLKEYGSTQQKSDGISKMI